MISDLQLQGMASRVFSSARLATWSRDTDGAWQWQPAMPAWLPPGCAANLALLADHTNEKFAEQLRSALRDARDAPFALCIPIATPARKVRWLKIQGEADDAGNLSGLVQDVTDSKNVEASLRNRLTQFRRAAADADAVVFEASLPDWRMRQIDPAIEALTGYPRVNWLSQPDFLRHVVVREDRPRFAPGNLLRPDSEQASFVFRLRRADGRLVSVSAVFRLHRGAKPGVATARGILMAAERDLSIAPSADDHARYLKVLYDENPAMFFSISAEGVVRSVNRYGANRLGYRPEELIGMRAADIHLPSHRPTVAGYFQHCLEDTGNVHHWETCLTRRDGSDVWVRASARAIEDAGPREVLIVCEDITETRRLSEKLLYQENHDLLTGLANRRRFEADLGTSVTEVLEHGKQHVLCYIDLDQFKVVNDTCGHDAGDQLLLRVSRLLTRHVRECDELARLGGDEFGILFRECDLTDAVHRAQHICDALASDRFEWEERSFRVTASLGLVDIAATEGTQAQLLSLADTACFAAKDQGRNRVVAYQVDNQEIARRHDEMSWVSRLQDAVDHDRFQLFCQPIRALHRDAASGDALEILLRLPDSDTERFVKPDKFLRAAENYQLAVRIDSWVFDRVLKFFESNKHAAQNLNICCINLSSQSLADDDFLDYLVGRIGPDNPLANRLCFEITETGVIANLEQAIAFMETLRVLGCRFALDDFGTGVSSFAYLKGLPVDIVKIDGLFVRHMATDPIDHALVSSINDIAHAMGKHTIAEYVEDDATLTQLEALGVDYAQGYCLSRPVGLIAHYDRAAVV